ncbi:IS5/IS1182 family transposase [Pontibacter actiniarum]|uniref:IS5/IS1182 family transposase n=1 Tax=Pontibacter actiniarum TaxID=323450 RepID=A0A1X9YS91_9BACT|nr:IS5/IS1182 family transposase [Pontibacter actiniarum]
MRGRHGKDHSPSVGILDSQSVKTVQQGGQRGDDAAKRVKGRERHLVVDTLGLLIMVIVHRADISERRGGRYLLLRVASRVGDFGRLRVFFADQGYGGQKLRNWVRSTFRARGWRLQIVNRIHKNCPNAGLWSEPSAGLTSTEGSPRPMSAAPSQLRP